MATNPYAERWPCEQDASNLPGALAPRLKRSTEIDSHENPPTGFGDGQQGEPQVLPKVSREFLPEFLPRIGGHFLGPPPLGKS